MTGCVSADGVPGRGDLQVPGPVHRDGGRGGERHQEPAQDDLPQGRHRLLRDDHQEEPGQPPVPEDMARQHR